MRFFAVRRESDRENNGYAIQYYTLRNVKINFVFSDYNDNGPFQKPKKKKQNAFDVHYNGSGGNTRAIDFSFFVFSPRRRSPSASAFRDRYFGLTVTPRKTRNRRRRRRVNTRGECCIKKKKTHKNDYNNNPIDINIHFCFGPGNPVCARPKDARNYYIIFVPVFILHNNR